MSQHGGRGSYRGRRGNSSSRGSGTYSARGRGSNFHSRGGGNTNIKSERQDDASGKKPTITTCTFFTSNGGTCNKQGSCP